MSDAYEAFASPPPRRHRPRRPAVSLPGLVVVAVVVAVAPLCMQPATGFDLSSPPQRRHTNSSKAMTSTRRGSRTAPLLLAQDRGGQQQQPIATEQQESAEALRKRAAELRSQAQALRDEIEERRLVGGGDDSKKRRASNTVASAAVGEESKASTSSSRNTSPFALPPASSLLSGDDRQNSSPAGGEYRLYVDVGREPGTWMDPRWGASGKRLEFTVDVRFVSEKEVVNPEHLVAAVSDNFLGESSSLRALESSPAARLSGGFDRMECRGGAYRIDLSKRGTSTVRFHLRVEGASSLDVTLPDGYLYFSLPAFGSSVSRLSTKPGPVTIREKGWHTGWYRDESRIVGTFRAVPLDEARTRDGY